MYSMDFTKKMGIGIGVVIPTFVRGGSVFPSYYQVLLGKIFTEPATWSLHLSPALRLLSYDPIQAFSPQKSSLFYIEDIPYQN